MAASQYQNVTTMRGILPLTRASPLLIISPILAARSCTQGEHVRLLISGLREGAHHELADANQEIAVRVGLGSCSLRLGFDMTGQTPSNLQRRANRRRKQPFGSIYHSDSQHMLLPPPQRVRRPPLLPPWSRSRRIWPAVNVVIHEKRIGVRDGGISEGPKRTWTMYASHLGQHASDIT